MATRSYVNKMLQQKRGGGGGRALGSGNQGLTFCSGPMMGCGGGKKAKRGMFEQKITTTPERVGFIKKGSILGRGADASQTGKIVGKIHKEKAGGTSAEQTGLQFFPSENEKNIGEGRTMSGGRD